MPRDLLTVHEVERGGFPTAPKLLPSEYFRRQRVISADPDETLTQKKVLGENAMRFCGLAL